MSPKFVLSLLLLCFVLLGLSDAQRRQQPQARYRVKGRNLGGDGSFGTDANPPLLDEAKDCNQNNLASNTRDRFPKRHH